MADFSRYAIPSASWLAVEDALPPPPPKDTPLEEMRRQNNDGRELASAAAFLAMAPRLQTRDHAIPARDGSVLEARTYKPAEAASDDTPLPAYMHLHGGGFFFGNLATEDGPCGLAALATGCLVLNVNYRHTPQHGFPTAWHDAADAFAWLHAHARELGVDPDRVVVGGVSAGAHLTSSLMVARRLRLPGFEAVADLPDPAGQVLIVPCLANPACRDASLRVENEDAVGSYAQCRDAPILPVSKMEFFIEQLQIKEPAPDDYLLNPGNLPADKVQGLPPAVFGVAGNDPLRDEGLLYAKKLAEGGIATNISVFRGMPHAFRMLGDKLQESKLWDQVIHEGITWALSKPLPTGVFTIKEL